VKTCDRNTMANALPEESCRELDLEKEMLTSLPTEIVLLVNLTALDLEHNRLVSLPPRGRAARPPHVPEPGRQPARDPARRGRAARPRRWSSPTSR
jgi:Leucine-rich repeat (LRR) protein